MNHFRQRQVVLGILPSPKTKEVTLQAINDRRKGQVFWKKNFREEEEEKKINHSVFVVLNKREKRLTFDLFQRRLFKV